MLVEGSCRHEPRQRRRQIDEAGIDVGKGYLGPTPIIPRPHARSFARPRGRNKTCEQRLLRMSCGQFLDDWQHVLRPRHGPRPARREQAQHVNAKV
jgi:hypothetical protein